MRLSSGCPAAVHPIHCPITDAAKLLPPMVYLLLAASIICSTAFAMAYRWANGKGADRYLLTCGIGVGSFAANAVFCLMRQVDLRDSLPITNILGCVLGILTALCLPAALAAIARGDLSITWLVLTLAYALASAVSMIYPGTVLSPLGLMGLAASIAAIVLVGVDLAKRTSRSAGTARGWTLFMTLAFLSNAASVYCFILAGEHQRPGSLADPIGFMICGNLVTAVMGAAIAGVIGRDGARLLGFAIGMGVGLLAFISALSVLLLLDRGVPGYLTFAAVSGGSNILVVVLSVVLYRERPGVLGWVGIVVGVLSLIAIALGIPTKTG